MLQPLATAADLDALKGVAVKWHSTDRPGANVRIRLLGTGTPTPSLRRMCSGYLVEIGNDVILLDHGFGAQTSA
jgi:hypothetical protein